MSDSDTRNIIDQYKGWTTDLIKKDLQNKTFPYAVLMEQFQGDFNIGTVVRNANAFGAKEVFYIGKKRWDRRGAVGVQNYTDIKYLANIDELKELKKQYPTFIGVDNIPGSIPVETFWWPVNCLLIFGEEGTGLTPETQSLCDVIVAITQYGSVRSLNAGTASGIIMYELTQSYPPPL